ncbi:MAG TPA: excinuclease ABC subunit C, partial [Myxococcales bacterium]|nr:excinuclease ABC subunit C [Myxococcales bacterium]
MPEGASIPRAVTRVTGIREGDLVDAVPPIDAWQRLCAQRPPGAPALAHFARFERRFFLDLQASRGETELPFPLICTHEIARRLLPELPRRGLRALAGYF